MNLNEIPDLLYHSKTLVESGYLEDETANQLVRECRLIGESLVASDEVEVANQAIKVLEAARDFSYWLRLRIEKQKRLEEYNQAFNDPGSD